MSSYRHKSTVGSATDMQNEKVHFGYVTSEIQQVAVHLRSTLAAVEAEGKADTLSINQLQHELTQIRDEKAFLATRMKKDKEWLAAYDERATPLEGLYQGSVAAIGQIYDAAKDRHAHGIDILKKEFDYHPTFKRAGDSFTGKPFKPK